MARLHERRNRRQKSLLSPGGEKELRGRPREFPLRPSSRHYQWHFFSRVYYLPLVRLYCSALGLSPSLYQRSRTINGIVFASFVSGPLYAGSFTSFRLTDVSAAIVGRTNLFFPKATVLAYRMDERLTRVEG